jgi:hypothetical protein
LAHNAIWQALKEKGVPQKIVTIIKAIYDQSTCNVLHKNQVSEHIPVLNGIKQGCVLSPLLSHITLDYVMSKVSKNSAGVRWELCGKLTDLVYADDMSVRSFHTSNANNARENRKRSRQSGLKD